MSDSAADARGLPRWIYASLAVSALVALLALGWVAWIAASPRYWFPGAYAAKGPRGDAGPLGASGPRGEVGPPGVSGDEDVAARFRVAF